VSGKPNALRQLAERYHIPVYQPQRMRDPEVFETFKQLQPDLNVMAFVTDIVPERILTLPRCGSIQYHPSLLPRHRGGSAINWAIIQGDRKTGLTIFWPDRGIDTGPVLLQKEVEIAPDDTTGSLYFDKLFPLGVEAIVAAIEMVKDGTAPKIVQDEALATYEPLCTEEWARIDWSQPVDTIYKLIRGCNPQPGANTTWHSQRMKIFDCEWQQLPQTPAPGEVIGIAADGFWVAARDGALLIKRLQPQGQAKITAADFIAASGLQVGDRLNT
jgi:methionyl-tRNA formyltransferase